MSTALIDTVTGTALYAAEPALARLKASNHPVNDKGHFKGVRAGALRYFKEERMNTIGYDLLLRHPNKAAWDILPLTGLQDVPDGITTAKGLAQFIRATAAMTLSDAEWDKFLVTERAIQTSNTNKDTTMIKSINEHSTVSALKYAFKAGAKQAAAKEASDRMVQLVVMKFGDNLPPYLTTAEGQKILAALVPLALHALVTEGPGSNLPKADVVRDFANAGMVAGSAEAFGMVFKKITDALLEDGIWDGIAAAAESAVGKREAEAEAPRQLAEPEDERVKRAAGASRVHHVANGYDRNL